MWQASTVKPDAEGVYLCYIQNQITGENDYKVIRYCMEWKWISGIVLYWMEIPKAPEIKQKAAPPATKNKRRLISQKS